jgi:serine/threonine protein kinase
MEKKLLLYSLPELKDMASRIDIPPRRSKSEMIQDISKTLKEYEDYKKEKIDKYTKHEQIGVGKEGTTYRVTDRKDKEYAMKTFRKTKASSTLEKEYALQKKASKKNIAPKIYDYDTIGKWILMEKMDKHLFYSDTVLTRKQQNTLIDLFNTLDEIEIFHGDSNLANYMIHKGAIKLIDFGFSKEFNTKLIKQFGERPNYTANTISMIIELKKLECPVEGYKYLLKHVSEEDKAKYRL